MLIQAIFKSEKEKTKIERLHIPNSKRYLDYIQSRNLAFMYSKSDLVREDKLNKDQYESFNTYKTMQNLITMYCEKHYEYANELEILKRDNRQGEIKDFVWSTLINLIFRLFYQS